MGAPRHLCTGALSICNPPSLLLRAQVCSLSAFRAIAHAPLAFPFRSTGPVLHSLRHTEFCVTTCVSLVVQAVVVLLEMWPFALHMPCFIQA